jgi:fused signal recognition particle receptor
VLRWFRRSSKTEETATQEGEATAEAEDAEAAALETEVRERTGQALQRTRRSWFGQIAGLLERGDITDELWEELEELLIGADVGLATTQKVLDQVRERAEAERVKRADAVRELLKEVLVELLETPPVRGRLWRAPGVDGGGEGLPRPAVVLVLGVNGTGKTTTIAKLAHAYRQEGATPLIAAADTFRAAAIEQLVAWGKRIGVDVIAHQQGGDPAAVVFDTLTAAERRGADIVIIDTAGRLHTKFNLMEELRKIRRVIQRKDPEAPHEVLLVLDATTGQNALAQARAFTEAADVTAVCLTKLDGSSKGGVVFAIADQLGIPVRFVGTGESPDDLAPFDARAFVEALFQR